MLSEADNERLCRVGPGTLMGNLLREYWIPALLTSEVPGADGPPLRVRLLGEDLVAFRDSSGRVGLLARSCAHRGASLFFGRNEENGLRCVYHGWKYDIEGRCIDMPSEPSESNFSQKIQLTAYPGRERNGVIWVYMGPRKEPPPLPQLEWNMIPESHVVLHKALGDCNWVQSVEGGIDTAHAPLLHSRLPVNEKGERRGLFEGDKAPHLEVVETPYGLMSGGRRVQGPTDFQWRINQFLMPFYTLFPGQGRDGELKFNGHAFFPIDDDHVMDLRFDYKPFSPMTEREREGVYYGNVPGGYSPASSDPLTQWRLAPNADNDYFRDYEAERTTRFCGIPSWAVLQDRGMQESMGVICDRTKEHLGTTDAMIIRMRRLLLNAATALKEGITPPGVDEPEAYYVRGVQVVAPTNADWVEAIKEGAKAGTR